MSFYFFNFLKSFNILNISKILKFPNFFNYLGYIKNSAQTFSDDETSSEVETVSTEDNTFSETSESDTIEKVKVFLEDNEVPLCKFCLYFS